MTLRDGLVHFSVLGSRWARTQGFRNQKNDDLRRCLRGLLSAR